jgi:hypothetical protein
MWIPNNFTLKAKGIADEKEDCLKYMARYSYPERYDAGNPKLGLSEGEYALLEASYDNASDAIDKLRATGALNVAEWRMFALDRSATDYLDHVPENKVPTGRALGPLKEDGTMGGGVDMMAQLGAALKERSIPVLLNHRAMRLVKNNEGRVVGLEAESAGNVVSLRARKAVVFATGGYVHNPEFVAKYQRNHMYASCAMPWSTGDFINIAGAGGARLGNMGGAWRTQIMLEEALEYDASQAEFPNQLMFMIYDQRTAEGFAGAYPLPKTPTDSTHVLSGDSLEDLAGTIQGRLKEISSSTGGFSLAPDFNENLKATIDRFSGFATSGNDEDFQRGAAAYDTEWHMVFSPMAAESGWPKNDGPNLTMHPFREEGPYYAMILAAGCLDTNGGPVIDASARVLNTEDEPIAGLYGAGNCIASPSREAYWGAGHTLGLSLTFGYIAANAAHREPRDDA